MESKKTASSAVLQNAVEYTYSTHH